MVYAEQRSIEPHSNLYDSGHNAKATMIGLLLSCLKQNSSESTPKSCKKTSMHPWP